MSFFENSTPSIWFYQNQMRIYMNYTIIFAISSTFEEDMHTSYKLGIAVRPPKASNTKACA